MDQACCMFFRWDPCIFEDEVYGIADIMGCARRLGILQVILDVRLRCIIQLRLNCNKQNPLMPRINQVGTK